jgi:hypothetical protein
MSTFTGFAAADAVDLALLDGAEQLGLQPHVHLADLVEQQRAAVRLLELADAPGQRAGEGALLVPEQLALQRFSGMAAQLTLMKGFSARRALGAGDEPSPPCRPRSRR